MNRISLLFFSFFIVLASSAQVEQVNETPAGVSRRLQYDIDITKDPKLGYVPKSKLVQAYQEKDKRIKEKKAAGNGQLTGTDGGGITSAGISTAAAGLTWVERGPYVDAVGPSNGNTRPGNGKTAGRVRAIHEDADGTTIWVGGVDGGLWKTTNIAANPAVWTPVNDYFSNMAIGSICQDPTDMNILYFGTGEKAINADAVRGAGIWRSTDHGLTWNIMPGTANFWNVSKVVCDAAGNLYVGCNATANNAGLQRFIKATSTWTNITPSGLDPRIADIELSSTGRLHVSCGYFNTAAASSGYRYTDNPATVTAGGWSSPATTFTPTNINVDLASSGNTLYALPSNTSYNVATIYKSTNGGANWAAIGSTPAFQQGQAWYNMAVAIDPNNVNNVIVGGLDCYKTTNGGTTWTKVSNWVGTTGQYVHADQQIMLWNANNRILVGCDGGVHVSTDGGTTFSDRNQGLRIKQFYSVAIHPTSTNYMLAGSQDNGVHQLNAAGLSNSVEVTGGDGAFVHIDQDQPQYQFGSYVYSNYRRSVDGGNTWSSLASNNTGRFINPTDYDDAANILYGSYGANVFSRWASAPTANTITSVAMAPLNGGSVSAVKVSPYVDNTVFFGGGGSGIIPTLIRAQNANATPTFTNIISASMAQSGANISSIELGTDQNNIIVAYSNYGVNNIWVSSNGGSTWSNVDGNLPDMPVRWAMFVPGDNSKAIIGTETGVWTTSLLNAGLTLWDPESSFPNVRTDMLQFRKSDATLVASTHGRGIFTANISALLPVCGLGSTLSVTGLTSTSATLNWTAVPNATNYDMDYRDTTVATWTTGLTGTSSLSFNLTGLTAGKTYQFRVRVNCAAGTGNYSYSLFTTPPAACNATYDGTALNNNTYTGAGVIPFNTNINGTISTGTDVDFYKFTITTGGTGTITLTTLPANYNLTLYNSTGTTSVATSSKTGTTNESISYTFAAGTYYVRVNPSTTKIFNSSSCYTLKVVLGTATGQLPAAVRNPAAAAKELPTIRVYPNPVRQLLNLYMISDNTKRTLVMYNTMGVMVHKQNLTEMSTSLDLSKLPSGNYTLMVLGERNEIQYKEIIFKSK